MIAEPETQVNLRSIVYLEVARLKPHPDAEQIPMLAQEEEELKASIKEKGILHPLDVSSRMLILDGVHRWRYAQALGMNVVPVIIFHYEEPEEENIHALLANLKRRQLNGGQKALLNMKILDEEKRLAQKRMSQGAQELATTRDRDEFGKFSPEQSRVVQDCTTLDECHIEQTQPEKKPRKSGKKKENTGKAAEKAGKKAGVSARTMYQAQSVAKASSILSEAVMQGEISLNKAYQQVKNEEKAQEVKKLQEAEHPLTDLEIMTKLGIPVQPYDVWNFPSCDDRFGHDYPGRIPGQLVAHCLYFWTEQGDLILDPMAGSGTTIDVCNVLNRRVLACDAHPCRDDIVQHNLATQGWPKETADAALIFWDPPYFKKKDDGYGEQSISRYARAEYLAFFLQMAQSVPTEFTGRLVFLMSDYTEEDDPTESIWMTDYINIFTDTGWKIERIIQTPLTTQSVHADIVKRFRESKRLARLGRGLVVMSR